MFRRTAFALGPFGHGLVSSVLSGLERLKAATLGDESESFDCGNLEPEIHETVQEIVVEDTKLRNAQHEAASAVDFAEMPHFSLFCDTLIVIEWEDTLFPTSWWQKSVVTGFQSIDECRKVDSDLRMLVSMAHKVLSLASEAGAVHIVTKSLNELRKIAE